VGASSTVHDRFQEWEQKGFFKVLWQAGRTEYDEVQGIEWEWQSVDRAMTKAPFGKGATGPNPTDRAKQGVKRSMLTDGAGIPLAIVVDGASRHDSKLLCATLDGIILARPEPSEEHTQASGGVFLECDYSRTHPKSIALAVPASFFLLRW
jgi:putative transposase